MPRNNERTLRQMRQDLLKAASAADKKKWEDLVREHRKEKEKEKNNGKE